MITVHTNYENIEAHKKITFGVNHSILLNTPTKLNIFISFTILASYFHKQTVSEIYFLVWILLYLIKHYASTNLLLLIK